MRYYVMEALGNVLLPSVPKGSNAEVVKASDLGRFSEVDYDSRNEIISDRLKLLLERFMPRFDFQPVVYLDTEKQEQAVFWRFRPSEYELFQGTFRSDGIVSHISFPNNDAPIIFTARSPKGVRSILVRMAVAESTLRRCILGLKFTNVGDTNDA